MKKKSILSSIFLVFFFLLESCTKEEVAKISYSKQSADEEILIPSTALLYDEKSSRKYAPTDDDSITEFSKDLAKMLSDKEIRQFIKTEANKKFDGDYDILVKNVLDAKKIDPKFKEKNTKFINEYSNQKYEKLKNYDFLNISVPFFIDEWNPDKQIPLVAIAYGAIEGEAKFLKAFDHKGKVYLLDALKEPNLPVIVVGENERVDKKGNHLQKISNPHIVTKSEHNSKKLKIACEAPYRKNGKNEILKALFMSNSVLNQVEAWWRGAPEIKVLCWAPINSKNFTDLQKIGDPETYFEPQKRAEIDNKWWILPNQTFLFNWDRNIISKNVLFYFYEWDGNRGSQTITLAGTYKISSKSGRLESSDIVNTTFTIPAGAKEITRNLIDQDACPPSFYNGWAAYNGGFSWAIINQ